MSAHTLSHLAWTGPSFETDLIESMKKKGWDGSEDVEKIQWYVLINLISFKVMQFL